MGKEEQRFHPMFSAGACAGPGCPANLQGQRQGSQLPLGPAHPSLQGAPSRWDGVGGASWRPQGPPSDPTEVTPVESAAQACNRARKVGFPHLPFCVGAVCPVLGDGQHDAFCLDSHSDAGSGLEPQGSPTQPLGQQGGAAAGPGRSLVCC